MDYENKYKELLARLQKAKENEEVNDERYCCVIDDIVPELKESEDEKIRKSLIELFKDMEWDDSILHDYNMDKDKTIAWLEKQGEQKSDSNFVKTWKDMRLEVYQQASGNRHEPNYSDDTTKMFSLNDIDEIIEKLSEQKLVEWSEEDENGLGDALWAIKQARTIAKDENDMGTLWYAERWLKSIKDRIQSKQSNKPQGKTALEAVKKEKVDNANKVESKFKVGDWVVRTNGESFCNGSKFAQIQSIELDGEMCYLDTGRWLYPSEMRLWTINDAQDGDLIYVSTEEKSIHAIFDTFDNGIIYFHCYLCADFTQGGYIPMGDVELIYPWQEANHQRFFQKMREAGYNWDANKKELKEI